MASYFLIGAAICFLVEAFGANKQISWMNLGFALVVISMLV